MRSKTPLLDEWIRCVPMLAANHTRPHELEPDSPTHGNGNNNYSPASMDIYDWQLFLDRSGLT